MDLAAPRLSPPRSSTSQVTTFNSLGGTATWGAGDRHGFLIPPSLLFPRGQAQLPVTGKLLLATRSCPACSVALPTPCLESSGVWIRIASSPRALYCPSLSSHLSTKYPSYAPKTKGFQILEGLSFPSRRYRGEETTSGFTLLTASRSAAEELPGRRPSYCRTCCFLLRLLALWGWWRVARD